VIKHGTLGSGEGAGSAELKQATLYTNDLTLIN
jgi:hypothetical protein